MTWHDYRMAITTLCSSKPDDGVGEFVTETPASLVPVRHPTGRKSPLRTIGTVTTKKRLRRLSNSERGKLYRSRRKDYVQTLQAQVDQLKKEVNQLAQYERVPARRLPLAWPVSIGAFLANVVNEYFALFKYGVPITDAPNASHDQLLLSTRQVAFLQRLMHPQVVFASAYGVREVLNQWEKYSLYHAGLKCEVTTVQVMARDPHPVVMAPTTLSVRFTRRTIEGIFPHLLWNEPLVQRLIGKKLTYAVKNIFYFGNDNKIHRYDAYVDFAAAFVRLLGNSDDTMTMMESALIRQECMIGDLLEEPPCVQVEEIPTSVPSLSCAGVDDHSDGSSDSLKEPSTPVGAHIGMSIQGILERGDE